MSDDSTPATSAPVGLSHVRLIVTDIARSRAVHQQLLGAAPASDSSDRVPR